MEHYEVGGCVRDRILGHEPKDVDYVVIGETPTSMLARGFRQVGADFPVFLHPESRAEYALARVERKSGAGYHGFTVTTDAVSLEEDLARRDLTINSMAMDAHGRLVDPYGGAADLRDKVLRHTSPAFQEDPVRVLRIARFLARYGAEWAIAPETWALMHQMRDNGELDHLVPERVWAEFEKGLAEPHFPRMLDVLKTLGLFDTPAFADYRGALKRHAHALEAACWNQEPAPVRFALAFPRTWDKAELRNCRVPAEFRETTHTVAQLLTEGLGATLNVAPTQQLHWIIQMGALQTGSRFQHVRAALSYLLPISILARLDHQVEQLRELDMRAVLAGCDKRDIPQRVEAARLACISN